MNPIQKCNRLTFKLKITLNSKTRYFWILKISFWKIHWTVNPVLEFLSEWTPIFIQNRPIFGRKWPKMTEIVVKNWTKILKRNIQKLFAPAKSSSISYNQLCKQLTLLNNILRPSSKISWNKILKTRLQTQCGICQYQGKWHMPIRRDITYASENWWYAKFRNDDYWKQASRWHSWLTDD